MGAIKRRTVRIGTRKSRLALVQTNMVAEAIEAACPEVKCELVPLMTKGDKILKTSLVAFGGKGAFVEEFEQSILNGDIGALYPHQLERSYESLPRYRSFAVAGRNCGMGKRTFAVVGAYCTGGIFGTALCGNCGTAKEVNMHWIQAKNILSATNGMNLYRGCTHGCIYCDSRSACYQMEHDFEDVAVKENAPQLLEVALRRKRRL